MHAHMTDAAALSGVLAPLPGRGLAVWGAGEGGLAEL